MPTLSPKGLKHSETKQSTRTLPLWSSSAKLKYFHTFQPDLIWFLYQFINFMFFLFQNCVRKKGSFSQGTQSSKCSFVTPQRMATARPWMISPALGPRMWMPTTCYRVTYGVHEELRFWDVECCYLFIMIISYMIYMIYIAICCICFLLQHIHFECFWCIWPCYTFRTVAGEWNKQGSSRANWLWMGNLNILCKCIPVQNVVEQLPQHWWLANYAFSLASLSTINFM